MISHQLRWSCPTTTSSLTKSRMTPSCSHSSRIAKEPSMVAIFSSIPLCSLEDGGMIAMATWCRIYWQSVTSTCSLSMSWSAGRVALPTACYMSRLPVGKVMGMPNQHGCLWVLAMGVGVGMKPTTLNTPQAGSYCPQFWPQWLLLSIPEEGSLQTPCPNQHRPILAAGWWWK